MKLKLTKSHFSDNYLKEWSIGAALPRKANCLG